MTLQAERSEDDNIILQTVATGLAACDESAYPLIHTLLTILLTLPGSTTSAERSFFYFKKTQDFDEVKDGGREIDRSSNVERST